MNKLRLLLYILALQAQYVIFFLKGGEHIVLSQRRQPARDPG